MTWTPLALRWPTQATQWLDALDTARDLAGNELTATGLRLTGLADLATTQPGPVGATAAGIAANGRTALAARLGEVPACLVVTPFQSGVGQGRGHQRFLSAPNLLRRLADKLADTDAGRPAGERYALVLLFLGTRFDQFSATLSRFNALLPIAELQRAERRAQRLFDLEREKWELPTAGTLPRWGRLPLERCTVTRAAKQAMAGQLAVLESYADSAPLAELAALAERKAAQALERARQLTDLQARLAGGTTETGMRARLIGPGDAAELRRQLLDGEAPGHEWVLAAGAMLVGSLDGLSFVRELVGL
ncbi:hypothetical protein [Azotobacter vinelandii]|uniref:hypothetical protein n=1 Tax=Azotobacter vinelandii TaxID=354 RepID=UPI0026661181|nr:hypothetical protein [Azotobacter vinelandii]WKN21506.1 hypothetical protein AVAEIV_004606 [Azotobacter vinelandii]